MGIDLNKFPTSETAKRMLTYITRGWYNESYVGKWTFQVMGAELDPWLRLFKETPDQLFVETATWGLRYHELKYGLTVREDLSVEERRARILEVRDFRMPMSPYGMAWRLKKITGCDVEVYDIHEPGLEEIPHPNQFRVRFAGEQEVSMKELMNKIRAMKQSHTTFVFSYLIATILNEEIFEPRVTYRMLFNWRQQLMNGEYFMNGVIFMNAGNYPDIFDRVRIRQQIEHTEDFEAAVIIPVIHNGRYRMDGTVTMHAGKREVL